MLIEMQVTLCIVTTTVQSDLRHFTAMQFGRKMQLCNGYVLCYPTSFLTNFGGTVFEIGEIGEISWPGARLAALKNISAHVVVPHHLDAANAGGWGNAEEVGPVDLGGGLEREVRQGLWQLQVGQCGR